MGRSVTLLVVFVAAALAAASATTSASITSMEGAPLAVASAASPISANIIMAAVEAFANAIDDAPPGTDTSGAINGQRPARRPQIPNVPVATTCLTVKKFKADVAETVEALKSAGVAPADIAGFERALLEGYEKFIVRMEGDKFCVRTDDFADWIVDVYLAALGGKLRK